jgi:post-segregation antitoxin (ccd killing protein)
LGNIVEEGRRIGSIADVQVGNMNPNAPVGTTLALLERSMKVMSGVQSRLHASLKKELRILAKCIHDFMPSDYSYEIEGDFSRTKDFDGRIDVIPVSDPNASTMAQRVTQYQSALQLAQQAPQLYDMGKLHRQMLEVLGIQDADDIIKLPEDIKPKDPVAENMAIMKQEPVKAFKYQDHEAHIAVHKAAAEDPKITQIIGQSPFAAAIQNAMAAHITEHVAFQYRKEMELQLGTALPDEDKPIPDNVEEQLSKLVAKASEKVLNKSKAEIADQQAKQEQQNPLTILQQKEMALKEAEFAHKKEMDIAKLKVDVEQKDKDQKIEVAKVATKAISDEQKNKRDQIKQGIQEGIDLAREFVDE